MTVEVQLYQDEDGVWIAEVPSLPGCVSDGATEEEALRNVAEAASACAQVRRERGLSTGVQIRQLEIVA
jgi:predicted RNase H-like HicB family nuclease